MKKLVAVLRWTPTISAVALAVAPTTNILSKSICLYGLRRLLLAYILSSYFHSLARTAPYSKCLYCSKVSPLRLSPFFRYLADQAQMKLPVIIFFPMTYTLHLWRSPHRLYPSLDFSKHARELRLERFLGGSWPSFWFLSLLAFCSKGNINLF